jgi:hypothetical protein
MRVALLNKRSFTFGNKFLSSPSMTNHHQRTLPSSQSVNKSPSLHTLVALSRKQRLFSVQFHKLCAKMPKNQLSPLSLQCTQDFLMRSFPNAEQKFFTKDEGCLVSEPPFEVVERVMVGFGCLSGRKNEPFLFFSSDR